MDQNGIGTDATIHEHIKVIQERGYAVLTKSRHFKPTQLGLSLVEAYRKLGIELFKPHLRRHIEAELKLIAMGHKDW